MRDTLATPKINVICPGCGGIVTLRSGVYATACTFCGAKVKRPAPAPVN